MSSLHKRSVHRSSSGCCICKAKSSSSRFTTSSKYEEYFKRCFRLSEARGGDICNACVLLVKRFKKGRAGPGVKNFVRERRRESCRERSLAYKRKHGNKKITDAEDDTDEKTVPLGPKVSDFIDLNFWKKKQICCGIIFVNSFGEAILDPRFIKKCKNHNAGQTSNMIQKRQTPLTNSLSFEQIVRKELEDVQEAEKMFKIPDIKAKKDSEGCCPKMLPTIDQDEGFFDRSLSSPCSDENISQSLDISD